MTTILGETTHDVIASFMQQVILQYQGYGAAYRRAEPRETAAIPVNVVPLDSELQPTGELFQAVTRDISYGGVGIFHTQPVDAPYVLIEITAPEACKTMRLLAQTEHCTRFGGFYVVGCRFAGVCPEDEGRGRGMNRRARRRGERLRDRLLNCFPSCSPDLLCASCASAVHLSLQPLGQLPGRSLDDPLWCC